jgi:hypothetical protein
MKRWQRQPKRGKKGLCTIPGQKDGVTTNPFPRLNEGAPRHQTFQNP